MPASAPDATSDTLTRILTVEEIEQDHYRGIATPGATGRSFGGQVIAQALCAAMRTAGEGRACHSLHAYFMRPGDATAPVLYSVTRDMDGRSFATRRVTAIQGGKPLLVLAASFQRPAEGLSHQRPMPEGITPPEELSDEFALAEARPELTRDAVRPFLRPERPIEVRPVTLAPPFVRTPSRGLQYRWIRSRGRLGDDPDLHRAGLAYASDLGIIQSALTAHGKSWVDEGARVASLDHALWLHAPFRLDDWLLFETESPWTGGARGLGMGRLYSRDGGLVASVAQEGMMRFPEP